MLNKLTQVSCKQTSNWDDIRKDQMRQIIQEGDINDDNIIYLKHCIKNYCGPSVMLWLENHLKEEELKEYQLIQTISLVNPSDKGSSANFNLVPIYLIQEGAISLYLTEPKEQLFKTFTKGDHIYYIPSTENVRIDIHQNTSAFILDRELFDSFRNKKETLERTNKLRSIGKVLPRLVQLDATKQEEILKQFKEIQKKPGSIVTVPSGGTADLFFLQQGTVVIFKYHQERGFLVVGCLRNEGVFNEQRLLFEIDSDYGAIVVNENANLYVLDKVGLNLINDNESVDQLRGIFQTKDRLYRNAISKFSSDLESFQINICKKYGLNYAEISEVILKNTKNGKIESTDRQELKEKNMKLFEKTVGNNPLKSALQTMTDREKTMLMGTPRVVPKKGSNFLGLSQQQEASLFALRQLGTNIRKGQVQTNSVMPAPEQEIVKTKMSLLQSEKEYAAQLMQKKTVSEKKLQEKEKLEDESQANTFIDKFKKSQTELIQKYEERKQDVNENKTEVQEEVAIIKLRNEVEEGKEQTPSSDQSPQSSSQSQDKEQQPQQQIQDQSSSSEEFKGRTAKRQNSQLGQSQRQMEIANKRKNLMKLGI